MRSSLGAGGVQTVYIGVISNPKSRRNRQDSSTAAALESLLDGRGQLAAPDGLKALEQTLTEWKTLGINLVAIHGGDGTAHRVITALARTWGVQNLPEIAFLPAGTMDIAARSLGIEGPPRRALQALLQAGDQAERIECSALKVVSGDTEQYGFLFGNAIIARFLEVQDEEGEASPALSAWILFRGSLSAMVGGRYAARLTQPFEGSVVVDGSPWPANEWTAVAAGTVAQMGLGFEPFPSVVGKPGHLHAVGISSSVPRLALDLSRIYFGKKPNQFGNHSQPALEMCITSARNQDFMIDGDFHTGGKALTVSVGPTLRIRYA